MSEQTITNPRTHEINTSPELKIADVIDDRFVVLPSPTHNTVVELAKTGTSHLYFAQDSYDPNFSDVAVKLHTSAREEDHVRYKREQILSERLRHPHLIPVVAVGVHSFEDGTETPYIATEYIQDGDLRRQRVQDEKDSLLVLHCLIDAVDALGELHRQGLVHRDFKPANIFHDGENAFLGDLGLVASIHEQNDTEPLIHTEFSDAISSFSVTDASKLIGTLPYLSRSRLEGVPATPEDDMFAVGVSTFQELANQYPWQIIDIAPKSFYEALKEAPLGTENIPAYVPREVIETVYACLDQNPNDRPSAEDFKALGKIAL